MLNQLRPLRSARLQASTSSSASASSRWSGLAPRKGGPLPVRRLAPVRVIDSDGFSSGGKYMLTNGLVDYYEILGVDDDAPFSEVKKAYRALAKTCHPDFMGEEGHDLCILLNEAYDTLSDPDLRAAYNAKLEQTLIDFEDDYTGRPLSKWMPTVKPSMAKNTNPDENRAVFVDEFSCIGCKQCVWCASATFRMENEFGRSRVFAQWLDTEELIQASIDSCPVSCIHWVQKEDLPALEYVMQVKNTERTSVGLMMGGQGGPVPDVFDQTYRFLKERKKREEALAKDASMRQYSAAQEKARRQATDALKKKKYGWMPNMEDFLASAFASVVGNGAQFGSQVGDDVDFQKVGRRRRSMRWDELEKMQRYSEIPLERALVPISVYAEY